MDRKTLTLSELNKNIQGAIHSSFPESIWVIGEISELKVNASGHCYMELVEKDAVTDRIIARARAIIWAYQYSMLQPYFETTTGTPLSAGLRVLFNVTIEFHELYGFSLQVIDLDPTYTLGDLARKKAETIARLEKEGIITMNREIPFPLVPKRIAVISSKTAAGFQDFMNELTRNEYGYIFECSLFEAVMQGNECPSSIIDALERIYEKSEKFDVVAIVRGGGTQSELSIFDDYRLAYHVAQFPLPILTGIGHEKDEPVIDVVAHRRLKTPTAVADFLIDQVLSFENRLDEAANEISDLTSSFLNESSLQLTKFSNRIPVLANQILIRTAKNLNGLEAKASTSTKQVIGKGMSALLKLTESAKHNTRFYIHQHRNALLIQRIYTISSVEKALKNQEHSLSMAEKIITLADPERLIEKGYSLTFKDGKIVRDIGTIKRGDILLTKIKNGDILSHVDEKKER